MKELRPIADQVEPEELQELITNPLFKIVHEAMVAQLDLQAQIIELQGQLRDLKERQEEALETAQQPLLERIKLLTIELGREKTLREREIADSHELYLELFQLKKQNMINSTLGRLNQTDNRKAFIEVLLELAYIDLFEDIELKNLDMPFLFRMGMKAKSRGISHGEFSEWLSSVLVKVDRKNLGPIYPVDYLAVLREIWEDSSHLTTE